MTDYLETIKTFDAIIQKTEKLDMVLFYSLIGTMIDRWAYVHDLDPDEAEDILDMLKNSAKNIHKTSGLW